MTGRLGSRLPEGLFLIAVWVLLWQRITLAAVLSGVVVALLVLWLARLPGRSERSRLSPEALGAVLHALGGIAAGAAVLSWWAVTGPRRLRGAAVVVPLRSTSNRVLTMVAVAVSAQPGTVVLYANRHESLLHVHSVPVRHDSAPDAAGARVRDQVWATEDRLVRAFGTAEDRGLLRRHGNEEADR
ncbi:Na+/H+ antiporter subunit E [Plantactinospora sp. WMMC1484]|uniref:Na+/H+ antiporter subunit E n=1 Tax=Plantactinospora sp. WMMC1484 TaxID=3404122 RepID=UPI003BF58B0C